MNVQAVAVAGKDGRCKWTYTTIYLATTAVWANRNVVHFRQLNSPVGVWGRHRLPITHINSRRVIIDDSIACELIRLDHRDRG